MTTTAPPASRPAERRQIVLPMRRSVEIAWQNIRLRLSRSLLVTSSITLALAFFVSILVNQAMQDSMRLWIESVERSPDYQRLMQQRDALDQQLAGAAAVVEAASHGPSLKKPRHADVPAGGSADPTRWLALRNAAGSLPLSPAQMDATESSGDAGRRAVGAWADLARQLGVIRQRVDAPQSLRTLMAKNGMPSTPEEVNNDRLQRRWLIGLSLLVAFIGITNGMLMSVTERFREIGTMKCLGALDGFIIRLFLIESFIQAIVGTLLGIVVGEGLGLAMMTVSYGRLAWQQTPVGGLVVAGVICFFVGLTLTIAGALYPAWQAARLQPIVAMRVDV
jgi:hypothetical protein